MSGQQQIYAQLQQIISAGQQSGASQQAIAEANQARQTLIGLQETQARLDMLAANQQYLQNQPPQQAVRLNVGLAPNGNAIETEWTDPKARYTQAVKDVLSKIQDRDAQIKVAKSAKRALTRKALPQATDVTEQEFATFVSSSSLGENVITALNGASTDLLAQLRRFFKKRGDRVTYTRPSAEQRAEIRQSPYGSSAARIAKLIRARIALSKLSARKLTSDYIIKRQAISQAARTGSASVMIQKINRGLKIYGSNNPATVANKAKEALQDGISKSVQRIKNKIDQSAATLTQYNQEQYNNYQRVLNENKITNDTLTTDDKKAFGINI